MLLNYCIRKAWDSSDLQTIDYWASNDVNLIINGGWSKRISCNGPNAGPNHLDL